MFSFGKKDNAKAMEPSICEIMSDDEQLVEADDCDLAKILPITPQPKKRRTEAMQSLAKEPNKEKGKGKAAGGKAQHVDAIILKFTNHSINKCRSELLASARLADGTIKNRLCVMGLKETQHTNFADISTVVKKFIDENEGQCTKQQCLDIKNQLMAQ